MNMKPGCCYPWFQCLQRKDINNEYKTSGFKLCLCPSSIEHNKLILDCTKTLNYSVSPQYAGRPHQADNIIVVMFLNVRVQSPLLLYFVLC